MGSKDLGHTLRRYRGVRTQAEIAEQAEMSRVAYGSIESGAASPKLETLERIAAVLKVRVQDLLTPVKVLTEVRFRAQKRMTSREQILVDVSRYLEDYAELESLLGEAKPYRLEKVEKAFKDKTAGTGREIAAAAAARAALQLDETEAIRDICGLLEGRGIKVIPLPVASDSFFGLSVGRGDGGPAIVVNVWDRISVERWIFTAAHELGHLLLHLAAFDVDQADEENAQEQEANQFASHFLMPHKAFAREWRDTGGLAFVDRVLKVKRIFRVSYRTVLYRLTEDPTYGNAIWQRFQVAYKARFGESLRRSDEPQPLSPGAFAAVRAADEPRRLSADDFVEDRLSLLVRTALESNRISLSRAAEILRLDLKKMRERVASWI
jgi:Zn-dependent peptidase ImmA (M78 family)/DNA-binding XRE family transcriptional regulator